MFVYMCRAQVVNDSNCHVVSQKEDEIVLADNDSGFGSFDSSSSEVVYFGESENDVLSREKEATGFISFKFQLKSSKDMRETIDVDALDREESAPKMNIRKYSFLSEKDVTGFVREPEAAAAESFSIQESYVYMKGGDDDETPVGEFQGSALASLQGDFHHLDSATEKEPDKSEAFLVDLEPVINSVGKRDIPDDVEFLSEKDAAGCSDSHTKTIKLCSGSSVEDPIMSLEGLGFELLPVNNFRGFRYEQDAVSGRGSETLMDFDGEKAESASEEDNIKTPEAAIQQQSSDGESIDCSDGFPSVDDYKFYASDSELTDFSDGYSVANQMKDDGGDENPTDDFMFEKGFFELDLASFVEESDKSEPCYYRNSLLSCVDSCNNNFSSESVAKEYRNPECEWDDFHGTVEDELQATEDTHLLNPSNSGYDDSDGLESLWEHEDLIQQLRMELKKVQAIGLPTIYEESESSETIDDLAPWTIEEKLVKKDPLEELHKFHKSYSERMRKLDIMNYQKMHAIGE